MMVRIYYVVAVCLNKKYYFNLIFQQVLDIQKELLVVIISLEQIIMSISEMVVRCQVVGTSHTTNCGNLYY